jgi:hypothetical protein
VLGAQGAGGKVGLHRVATPYPSAVFLRAAKQKILEIVIP